MELDPVDPGDRVFESAFNDHQRRTTDGRRLLGPDAVATVIDLFRAAGWSVRVADSPWRLDAPDRRSSASGSKAGSPPRSRSARRCEEWADEYLQTRAAQLAAGRLRVVVHHQDLLAWPP